MSVGCRIRKDIIRPDQKLMERFRDLPVANIDDTEGRDFAMNHRIRLMNRSKKLVGPAFTVKVPEGDNVMLNKAMDLARPGDVLVVDAGGYPGRAIFGEIIVTYCRKRGLAGIVCDGGIRDSDAIGELEDFPVYAIGVCPNGPYHNGPGEVNFPVSCGGIVVKPGDIIVADPDGVISLDPSRAEAIAAATEAVSAKEAKLLAGIRDEGVYPRPWVDGCLERISCEYVD